MPAAVISSSDGGVVNVRSTLMDDNSGPFIRLGTCRSTSRLASRACVGISVGGGKRLLGAFKMGAGAERLRPGAVDGRC